jgi:GT2 family glycosyltransferase
MPKRYRATIVVPSYNRPDRLRGCLEALMSLRGGPYDIVVVDDGSREPLAPVCAAFDPDVRCLRQDNSGPAAARNAGAAAARSGFLAFTDDDCRPEPGWVEALLSAQSGDARRLVGGRVINLLDGNVYAAASQSLCDFLYDYFGAETGDVPFFTSNNIGCDKAAFERLGGFDRSFPLAAAEDRDFGLRWSGTPGGTLVYAPGAVVGHAHNLTFRSFLRQHSNYGRGARHLHRVMDGRGDARPKIERLAFYLRLIGYPLGRPGRARLAQAALLALSQAAMISGYVRSGRDRPPA